MNNSDDPLLTDLNQALVSITQNDKMMKLYYRTKAFFWSDEDKLLGRGANKRTASKDGDNNHNNHNSNNEQSENSRPGGTGGDKNNIAVATSAAHHDENASDNDSSCSNGENDFGKITTKTSLAQAVKSVAEVLRGKNLYDEKDQVLASYVQWK